MALSPAVRRAFEVEQLISGGVLEEWIEVDSFTGVAGGETEDVLSTLVS
jgi:hypothetical protein